MSGVVVLEKGELLDTVNAAAAAAIYGVARRRGTPRNPLAERWKGRVAVAVTRAAAECCRVVLFFVTRTRSLFV